MPAETVKDSRKPVFQVVAYDANGSTLAMGQTAGDVEIFTLFERPEPKITLANGKLTLANAEMYNTNPTIDWVNFGGAILDNIHLYGILLEAKIEFYKDGAAAPTYIAEGGFVETTALSSPHGAKNWSHFATSATEGKFKNNIAMYYNAWKWNGATEATVTAPAFEPGNYTVKYVAYYYPIVGGSYGQDRVLYAANTGMLQQKIAREGEVEGSFSIASVEGIAAARNGYKGIEVTWNAVQGATSYEVVADGQKATVSEAKAQFTAADTQHSFTNFSVTALDANGAVVAVGNLAAETQVWNIDGVQPLTSTFDGSNLVVSGANNLIGTAMHIKVEFVKDGTVVHTAEMDKLNNSTTGHTYNATGHYDNADYNGARYGRLTNPMFAAFPGSGAADNNLKWAWNGTTPCDTPAFEPGEYTVNYTAYYYPIVNGFWTQSGKWEPGVYDAVSGNRVAFKTADILTEKIEVKGSFDNYVVGMKFEVSAAIDEGTTRIDTQYDDYTGLKSINGMLESAKISWNLNVDYDYVEIAYLDKSVQVAKDEGTSKVVEGLKVSPVEFKVSAYKNGSVLVSENVSTDVYVLPATAHSDKWIAKAVDGGHQILAMGWNTKQYATVHCTFNIYEKGSDTAVFDKPVNYSGSYETITKWLSSRKIGVEYSGPGGNRCCHGGDGNNWDENNLPTGANKANEAFAGLDPNKQYVVKYTLKVWPYIYDASNPNNKEQYQDANGNTKMNYFYKKVLMGAEKGDNYWNAIDLAGEHDLVFE